MDHQNILLCLQREHRSNKIWNGDESEKEKCLTNRRQDLSLWNYLEDYPLHHRVLNLFHEAGFGGILQVGRIEIDNALITAMIERWRPETHTFHLRTGEATITMQDMEVMFGMVVDGAPLVFQKRSFTKANRINKIYELTGFLPEETDFHGSRLLTSFLTTKLNHLPEINDDSTDIQVEQRFWFLLILLIGGTLFSDKSTCKMSTDFLQNFGNIQLLSTQAWGAATLAYLYHNLHRASLEETTNVCGFTTLLQVWTWEHIIPLKPGTFFSNFPGPLACKWSERFHQHEGRKILVIIREILDNLRHDQFIWKPYSEDILNALPDCCQRGRNVWMTKVPLIFEIIREWHMADRVVRQFGFPQHIPDNIHFDIRHYKLDNRKSINREAQQMLNNTEIIWNNRLQHIVTINPNVIDAEYFDWYRQNTRMFIANSDVNVRVGYQPMGGRHEALARGHETIIRRTQEVQNDENYSFQSRQLANEMSDYARDSMNAAHLNFQSQYAPWYQYQPQPQYDTGFTDNQNNANAPSPYYPVFDNEGASSSSVPDYTQQVDSLQTPNVPILGFQRFSVQNIRFGQHIQQREFQNSPIQDGRLNFSTDLSESQNLVIDEDQSSQQYDINNPRRTTRPHVPTMFGTGTHKQQQHRRRQ